MRPAPLHPDEADRLRALRALNLLDTPPEQGFEDVVALAGAITSRPVHIVSLVDEDRQWFKARRGTEVTGSARDFAFCAHAILEPRALIIPDARLDPRFSDNPLVVGPPHIISYVGVPLRDPESGLPVGTLCSIDHRPGTLTSAQLEALIAMGRQVETLLRLRRDNLMLRRAQVRLEASEANLRAILSCSPLGIFLTDLRGDCSFVNPAWSRITGLDAASARGDGWMSLVPADERPLVHHHWYVSTGNRGTIASERRLVRPDGDTAWVRIRSAPIVVGEDNVGYVGMIEDITESRRVEALLRQSEGRLLEAQSLSLLGHWTFDLPTQQISWSPQVFRNYRRSPSEGAPDFDTLLALIHPEDRPRFFEMVRRCIEKGTPYDTEHRAIYPDGGVWHARARGRLRRGPNGEPLELSGTCQDVTEEVRVRETLERARQSAEAAARSKADFLATMSHEIRTPLNGVIGMTELMRRTPLTAEQADYVDIARSCGESLLSAINDILDFSKIEAGKVELEEVVFAPRAVVEDTLAMVAAAAQAKGLEMYARYGAGVPPLLMGDPARLRQILLNLISNAVKFTEAGEVEVEVGATLEPDGLCRMSWVVRDTGVGIPETRFDKLFLPFSQINSDTTRRFGGTGLGLAISHRLAEWMGGTIDLQSKPLEGSTFTLRVDLPVVRGLPRDADAPAPEPEPLPAGTTILLVDDHPGARAAIAEDLVRAGATVRCCATVLEAEAVLRSAERLPTVMIIDAGMPGMTGCAFIRRLRQERTRLPPVILAARVTDRADTPLDLFEAVLVRPLRLTAVLQAIGSCSRATPPEPVPSVVPALGGSRVLVAEDSPINQMLVAAMLRKLACRVDLANDGQEAIEACAKVAYDLVLMDCQMPRVDGFAATRTIRENLADSRLPIIALTANALEGDRERCLAAGMDDYLTKPLTLAALEKMLTQRGLRPGQATG